MSILGLAKVAQNHQGTSTVNERSQNPQESLKLIWFFKIYILIDLNIKPIPVKFLRENRGKNSVDLRCGKDFLHMMQKVQFTKEKGKMDFI